MPNNQTNLFQNKLGTYFALKLFAAALLVAIVTAAIGSVSAASNRTFTANANGNKLQCFSGTGDNATLYAGDCAFDGNTAVIKTEAEGATGSYGGVYIQNSNLDGKLLTDVNKLAFTYEGTGAAGGSPRISIPIDENNDGKWDQFAFVDTTGCADGDANNGTLDVINDATCTISYNSQSFENWTAFVTANPSLRIAKNNVTFVIVDQPGTFSISNVQLGKGPAKPAQTSTNSTTTP